MKTEKITDVEKAVQHFIKSANKFDVNAVLALFAGNAVIDDVSVGDKFKNIPGVRRYLEQFFVGYKTVTRLESIEIVNAYHAKAKVDFTGDFGHETGGLDVTINKEGLITAIDAYLD